MAVVSIKKMLEQFRQQYILNELYLIEELCVQTLCFYYLTRRGVDNDLAYKEVFINQNDIEQWRSQILSKLS
jgi:hypothetical protein